MMGFRNNRSGQKSVYHSEAMKTVILWPHLRRTIGQLFGKGSYPRHHSRFARTWQTKDGLDRQHHIMDWSTTTPVMGKNKGWGSMENDRPWRDQPSLGASTVNDDRVCDGEVDDDDDDDDVWHQLIPDERKFVLIFYG